MPELSLETWGVLAVAFLLISSLVGNLLLNIKREQREERQSREPRPPMHEVYATRKEVREVAEDVDALRAKIDEGFEAQRKSSSASREKLYDRLNATDAQVAEIKKETQMQGHTLGTISAKLDVLADKVVTALTRTEK